MTSTSKERELIETALKDLDAFHKFLKRREWRYRWLIRGKLILDINHAQEGKPQCVEEMAGHSRTNDVPLREVVFLDNLMEVLDMGYSWSCEYVHLPTSGSKCDWCSGGWTAETFLDRHVVRRVYGRVEKQPGFYHPRCWELRERCKERQFFERLLSRAGVCNAPMVELPNRYWGAGEPRPWFDVSLPGGDITIGWRKRVIHIECPAFVGVDKMFPDENVTKGPEHIHAWNEEKAVMYLQAIAPKLAQPRKDELTRRRCAS